MKSNPYVQPSYGVSIFYTNEKSRTKDKYISPSDPCTGDCTGDLEGPLKENLLHQLLLEKPLRLRRPVTQRPSHKSGSVTTHTTSFTTSGCTRQRRKIRRRQSAVPEGATYTIVVATSRRLLNTSRTFIIRKITN